MLVSDAQPFHLSPEHLNTSQTVLGTHSYVQHRFMRSYISLGHPAGHPIRSPFSNIAVTSLPFIPYNMQDMHKLFFFFFFKKVLAKQNKTATPRHGGVHIVWFQLYEVSKQEHLICDAGVRWVSRGEGCVCRGNGLWGSVLHLGADFTGMFHLWKNHCAAC